MGEGKTCDLLGMLLYKCVMKVSMGDAVIEIEYVNTHKVSSAHEVN